MEQTEHGIVTFPQCLEKFQRADIICDSLSQEVQTEPEKLNMWKSAVLVDLLVVNDSGICRNLN